MRPHVCIPSGCQQWFSKTIAVGVDKFAYMSSLAVYVYSSITYLPLAILAKHEERLSALALSPFDSNLLACAISNQEIRVYDVDTELIVCRVSYPSPKGKATIIEWHRTNPGVLLLAIGSCVVAWDFTGAADAGAQGHANGSSHGRSGIGNVHSVSSANGVAAAPPPQPSSPPLSSRPQSIPRSMLMRLRNARGPGGDGGGEVTGRWVSLRDVSAPITAMDQCGGGGSSGGPGTAAGSTLIAVATADSRIFILELEPSGLAVRGELRTITLPDTAAAQSVFSGSGGPAAGLAGIGPPSTVCWEPLACNGLLLIVGRSGVMALYDTTTNEVVLSYGKQPATASRFAQFLPSQPGNFLLSSSRSGALQLWNVSQPQPQRLIKLGGGLVQCFALMKSTMATITNGAGAGNGNGDAAAMGKPRTAVLVSFSDGAIFSYDLDSQQVLWRQEGGHTETVFDCRFCTTDPNMFATASFDSSVRVWDVRTARCVKLLLGAEGILYSVSWSADGKLLAASNDAGVIYLYEYGRGVLIKALRQHTKQSLRVVFHPYKSTLLASASIDGSVLVYTVDGETVRALRHSSPVSCIAWSSLAPSLLASTSEEGELFVWDVSRPAHECLVKTLVKHNSRSFNVEFSPLLRNYLLSSSNDRTARVWDVSSGDCLVVLSGHTAEVRALAWHPEVAHLCFTGSWDASVRVWDVRTGNCIHVANDHHADVYGIACHPRRPFFMVTCSRDTTLRLWSILGLTPNLLPQALVRSISSLRAMGEEAAALPLSAAPIMSGQGSLELADRLGAVSCTPLERFAAISEFFLPPACIDVFWDIARYVRYGSGGGGGDSGGGGILGHLPVRQRPAAAATATEGCGGGGFAGVCGDDSSSLHHWTTAKMAMGSAANHLELAASSKARLGSVGSVRRDELLREAAQQHLLAGNVEHCCELLAEVGDWERALALAPVVGMALWQRLLKQRLQAMAEAETQGQVSDLLPLYLVSGQVPELVDMLSASCLYDTAFNVAAVQASGGYAGLNSGSNGGAHGGSGGGGRERCNSAGSPASTNGGDLLPPLQRPPSPNISSLMSQSVAAGLANLASLTAPLGLERVRSSTADLSSMTSATTGGIPVATFNGGSSGASSGLGGMPLPLPLPPSAGSSIAAAVSPLPPLMGRGGTLPSLNRSPSLRPPPLTPIQMSSAVAAVAAAAPSSPLSTHFFIASRPSSPPTNIGGSVGALAEAGIMPLPVPLASPAIVTVPSAQPAAPSSPRMPTPPSGSRLASSLTIRQSRCAAASGGGGGGGGGTAVADACGRSSREAFDRAVRVRCAQARGFLAQGLPLQAACCALTVDDVVGAVGLLLRGGQEEMALALVSGLTRPIATFQNAGGPAAAGGPDGGLASVAYGVGVESISISLGGGGGGGGTGTAGSGGTEAAAAVLRPQVLVAAACKREAAGDYLTAAELLKQVPSRTDLRDLLAGRCHAHADPTTAARVFRCLGLKEPQHYAAAAELPGALATDAAAGWEGVRRLLLAGQQAAAADRALAAVRRLVESGERVAVLSPEWQQAWGVINSLEASALGEATWARVFCHAAYLGALLALEQGYAGVGMYLVRVLEDWVIKQPDAELPVPQARLAAEVSEALDECLALPAYGSPGEVHEALLELVLAPPGSSWMQGMLQARLAKLESRLPLAHLSSTPTSAGVRSIRSPLQGGGGGSGGVEGLMSPSASSSSLLARRIGGTSFNNSVRLSSLELGASSGRFSIALSALQPAVAAAVAAGGGGGGVGGGGGSGAGGAATLVDLARGPVVVAAAHVPTRSSSSMIATGGLPMSAVSGVAIRGAAVQLDDRTTWLSLSEALALRRVMLYSPLGTGRLLLVT
ncbi:hypothetical protein VaNZ11_004229 [Volvox africanus]|uniref:Anaphase-promoting complex subunit 4 WD40 domain-containing protein n=1 Tax=Volvox africanus TaxID=51714 RepID=A0ABQ5RXH3_9CHLO|nr:hypothetical protein VaNZ11_004229 [Volvox africanus]